MTTGDFETMRSILAPSPGIAPASLLSPPAYLTCSSAVSSAAPACCALTWPVKIAVLPVSSMSRRFEVISMGPSPPPSSGAAAGFAAAASLAGAASFFGGMRCAFTSSMKATSRVLFNSRISFERMVPDGMSTRTGSLEKITLSLVRMVARDSFAFMPLSATISMPPESSSLFVLVLNSPCAAVSFVFDFLASVMSPVMSLRRTNSVLTRSCTAVFALTTYLPPSLLNPS